MYTSGRARYGSLRWRRAARPWRRAIPRTDPQGAGVNPSRHGASRIFGLDVLRTLAITQVLAGHGLSLYVGQTVKAPLEGFYGFLGVEVFFVVCD